MKKKKNSVLWDIFIKLGEPGACRGLVPLLILSGFLSGGCGKTAEVESVTVNRTSSRHFENPEQAVSGVLLKDRSGTDAVEYTGYTLRSPRNPSGGDILGVTLYFRSLKPQDGKFIVTIGLADDRGTLDWVEVPVSTPRWSVQENSLERNEVFRAQGEVRMPLGYPGGNWVLIGTLQVQKPGNQEKEKIGEPFPIVSVR